MCQSTLCISPNPTEQWHYTGSVWEDSTHYKHPGTVLLLCNDCAFRVMTTHSPALQSGQATLRSMILNKHTIHCRTCLADFRLESLHDPSRGWNPKKAYCPNCGSPTLKERDSLMDYWELISEELDLPLDLTKMLYDAWLHDPTPQFETFREYVQAMEEEVATPTPT